MCSKNNSGRNPSKGGIDKLDNKRLMSMSMEEIKAYYDSVEPLDPGDEQQFYERVTPKIMDEISKMERKGKSRRRISARRCVILAVCLVLMFSVAGQALMFPLLSDIIEWTKEYFVLRIASSVEPSPAKHAEALSDEVKEVWGEELYNALQEIGQTPALPTWIPEGFEFDDITVIDDGDAGTYIGVCYQDSSGRDLRLTIELLSDKIDYMAGAERNRSRISEYVSHDITFYCSRNLERQTVTWSSNGVVINISGIINDLEMTTMIESVNGGNDL